MRALLSVVLLATGLWTGYWWLGASTIETVLTDWIARQPRGAVSTSGVVVHGIPNRFDLTVSQPVLADAASGLMWKAPFLQVYAMTWKPWHLIAALPSEQVITLQDQTVTVASDQILASLTLHPNNSLGLNETVAEAHGLRLTSGLGWTLGVGQALASSREDATRANTHRLGLAVTAITPDPALMRALAGTDLPTVVDEIYLDAHASFSAPLDRFAAQSQPNLTRLQLDEARISWGALHFTAKGTLTAGQDGLAAGEVALRVDGWRRLPPILVALGLIKPDIAATVERAMEVMAAQGGDPEVLQVVLKCAQGRMDLGPLPLGPAPRFF